MPLTAGTRLGSYVIDAPLGAGGMGEVYRAQDTRLGRDVAIKVLPAHFLDDPDRRARFEREARLLATLNHPNVGAIYGIEEGAASTGATIPALVLELIEGPTLAEMIGTQADRRPLPLDQTLQIAGQIADALDAAHEKSIVHRDLKPGNVKVTPGGVVKVLDFGLARSAAQELPSGEDAVTVAADATSQGMILGTPAYMSPEQARGLAVDKRIDIWAFGCVLYEMLAGRKVFAGPTASDIVAAILHHDPNWSALPPGIPPSIARLLKRCLEKDQKRRLRDIGEARIAIDDALAGAGDVNDAAPLRSKRVRPAVTVTLTAVVIALAAAAAWFVVTRTEWLWRNPLEGAYFERLTSPGTEIDGVISANGQVAAYIADHDGAFDAWITQLGTGVSRNLTSGYFPDLGNDNIPNVGLFPDGSRLWLAIGDGKAGFDDWFVPTLGGTPRKFLAKGVGMAWSPDGTRLAYHEYTPGDPIYVANADGSNPRQLFVDEQGYHCHFLSWSPDGRYLYFVKGLLVTQEMDVWRLPVAGGPPERITRHQTWVVSPVALDDRTVVYSSLAEDGSGPWLYAIDVNRKVPHRIGLGFDQYRRISVSADGRRLLASVANPSGKLWRLPLLDRAAEEKDVAEIAVSNVLAVSPRTAADGILFLSSRGGSSSLWKLQGESVVELWKSLEGGVVSSPAVASDGRIAFTVRRLGRGSLYVLNGDGTGAHVVGGDLNVIGVPSWSPDSKWLAVSVVENRAPRLVKVPVEGGPAMEVVKGFAANPVWSPDGRMIVYTGQNVSVMNPLLAVTPDGKDLPFPKIWVRFGGERFRFTPDSKGLVYLRGDWKRQDFHLLDIASGESRPLSRLEPGYTMNSFDVSSDGRTIVFDRIRDNSDLGLIDLQPRR
jgi:Tol biopolymer transport system component/tRNA A-37 threonylcarbamoyl transferase component Bud32